ncbi:hypothetical protein L873DRAFT_1813473 [Choiromyces venosus 120613-1]|uniref:Uncharacterized protein n=1 Tax=Choiromyces venosus 120613-1 TaxID=1336337 RepID=A0A3N4JER5_9PEZI|nr:hypothetical protein L873DRAFT_1813473 [Choiromyces venosus 120613-1]
MASHTSLMPASPLLTPATAFWTLPFGAYLLFLSTRVSVGKNELGAKHKTELGKTEMASGEDPQNPDPLSPAGRCLGNYLGDASVAMILALLAELNGGNRGLVNYALGALFLGKVAEMYVPFLLWIVWEGGRANDW